MGITQPLPSGYDKKSSPWYISMALIEIDGLASYKMVDLSMAM